MPFSGRDWFSSELIESRKKNFPQETIQALGNIENLFSLKGSLRILLIMYKIGKDLRYVEIQEIATLHLGTLNRGLKFLSSRGLVESIKKNVNEPRKETVTFYRLAKKGDIVCEILFGDTGFLETINNNTSKIINYL